MKYKKSIVTEIYFIYTTRQKYILSIPKTILQLYRWLKV